jgi:hypothetical protein
MGRVRNSFLWDETEDKKKYHLVNLVNWQTVGMPKDKVV